MPHFQHFRIFSFVFLFQTCGKLNNSRKTIFPILFFREANGHHWGGSQNVALGPRGQWAPGVPMGSPRVPHGWVDEFWQFSTNIFTQINVFKNFQHFFRGPQGSLGPIFCDHQAVYKNVILSIFSVAHIFKISFLQNRPQLGGWTTSSKYSGPPTNTAATTIPRFGRRHPWIRKECFWESVGPQFLLFVPLDILNLLISF